MLPLKKFFDFFNKECEKVNNNFLKVEIKKLVENCLHYVKWVNQTLLLHFNIMLKVTNTNC